MLTYLVRLLIIISCGDRMAKFESTDTIELPTYLPPVPGLEIWLKEPGDGSFFCEVKYPSYTIDDKSLLLVCEMDYSNAQNEFDSVIGEFVSSPLWEAVDSDGVVVEIYAR